MLKAGSVTRLDRPGCLEFYLAWPWKPPSMEVAQSLWATYRSVWLQVFPAFSHSCFSLCLLSHPLAVHHCEKPSSISLMTDIFVGTGKLLLSLLEAFSSPCWKSPVSLVSSHMASAPALDHPGGPLLNLVWFIYVFPIPEAKAGCNILGVSLMSTKWCSSIASSLLSGHIAG